MRFRPEVLGVTESPLLVIGALAEQMPGSIKLCYGESDAPTPDFICQAADDALRAGHTFYTHTAGYSELRDAIAGKVNELHGTSYRGAEVMSTVGASMAIYAAARACLGPGDNAVIISPAYSIFVNATIIAGAEPRAVPLAAAPHGFHLDMDRVRAAIDERTRMLMINSPNNPTGWIISDREQTELLELATRHDVMILSDEVYERIVYGRAIVPSFARAAMAAGALDHLIVGNSFSKTYNMTGWRLGWAQSTEPVIRAMHTAAEFMTSSATAMVQQAGIVALRDGEPFVACLRATYERRRDLVVRELSSMPGLSLMVPDGAFFAFARVEGLVDSTTFCAELLRDAGVALTPGVAFGESGEGFVRLCFASNETMLSDALDRIRRFMERRASASAPVRAGVSFG
ncbi:MAG TPA: aminotransferase class I/II-fold pyridoxal phosphate-dependent enzyme [Gemmatimonadaceae bacterium]|nr:aminotransferase class I/II-fold pyridoxal phosphate-dependent enzyme [Gemmatimonadaceae bacterium]